MPAAGSRLAADDDVELADEAVDTEALERELSALGLLDIVIEGSNADAAAGRELGLAAHKEITDVARWTHERLGLVLERHGRSLDELAGSAPRGPEPEAGKTLAELEREAITAALERHDENRRKVAEELGIGLRTLYDKLKRLAKD